MDLAALSLYRSSSCVSGSICSNSRKCFFSVTVMFNFLEIMFCLYCCRHDCMILRVHSFHVTNAD